MSSESVNYSLRIFLTCPRSNENELSWNLFHLIINSVFTTNRSIKTMTMMKTHISWPLSYKADVTIHDRNLRIERQLTLMSYITLKV